MSTLREICEEAGFHGHALDMAVAIATAESGGRPTAFNGNLSTGDNSYGLFQINMLGSLGPARLQEYGLKSNNDLYDPLTNARVAYKMSDGGTNWEPWSTYKRGDYVQYLGSNPTAELTSTSDAGDPAAGGAHTNFDQIDAGAPVSHAQSQQDVATHEWAQLFGIDLPGAPPPSSAPSNDTALHKFLDSAVAQRGDAYVFGAKGAPNDPHPKALDCSGLTKWAAEQAGVELPDGAAHQYLALKAQGMLIPVDQAIHTPGALLFHFDGEPTPGQGEPEEAHVAISLGNGMTIEAANPQDGVNEFQAGGGRFDYAAVIPGISDSVSQTGSPATSGMSDVLGHGGVTTGESTQSDAEWELGGTHTAGHSTGLGSGLSPTDTADHEWLSLLDSGHGGGHLDVGHP